MIELRRGCVVLYSERGEYTGKLRPGVVLQRDNTLVEAPSVTLCGLTSHAMPSHEARIVVVPDAGNGVHHVSFVMIDKVVSISRPRVREVLGRLDPATMSRVDLGLRRWLDL